jgi:hypothetical protein
MRFLIMLLGLAGCADRPLDEIALPDLAPAVDLACTPPPANIPGCPQCACLPEWYCYSVSCVGSSVTCASLPIEQVCGYSPN